MHFFTVLNRQSVHFDYNKTKPVFLINLSAKDTPYEIHSSSDNNISIAAHDKKRERERCAHHASPRAKPGHQLVIRIDDVSADPREVYL